MTLPRLEISIRRILTPVIRQDGFRGSGRTFRRIVGDTVQVLNVQGSQYGGKFAINLGMQPISIPNFSDQPVDTRKITEPDCEFRCRLSETGSDQWWGHDGTEVGMDEAMRKATCVYETVGRRSLALISATDSPVFSLTPAEFQGPLAYFHGFNWTTVRTALALAHLRAARGDHEQARAFACIALADLSPAATALRTKIKEFLEDDAALR
jgi:Domain of unknown function (DUF4304)